MSQSTDREYYICRAAHARRLANAAASDRIRAIHLEMAMDYDQLAAEPQPRVRLRMPIG